jgi:uncharacterized membrane protein
MEKKSRSILKAITWRMIGTIVLASVSYLITGSLKHMTFITIFFECIQLINYYWHERVWMKVKWGRIPHPLQELPVSKKLQPEHMEIIKDQLEGWGYLDIENKKKNKKFQRTRKALPLGVRLEKETVDELT